MLRASKGPDGQTQITQEYSPLDPANWPSERSLDEALRQARDNQIYAAQATIQQGGVPAANPGYPDNNPKTAFGAKKIPLEVVPPSAIHALAEAFADGAKKYGPYNWREKSVSSSVYYGAALRHLMAWWDGEDLAEDSGINHLHHALACIALIIDGKSVGKLNDNRPPKGAASKFQKEWLNGN